MNALFLELPWLERTQPEGIYLAAWLSMFGTVACAVSLLISYQGVLTRIPGDKVALLLVILNISMMVLVAFTWQKTIFGYSVFLFLGTFGASTVGNLQFMTLVP